MTTETHRFAWYTFDAEYPEEGFAVVFTVDDDRAQAVRAARGAWGWDDETCRAHDVEPDATVTVHRAPRLDRFAADGQIPEGVVPVWVDSRDGTEHDAVPDAPAAAEATAPGAAQGPGVADGGDALDPGFRPSQVALDAGGLARMPLVATMGRVEVEFAAALLVNACARAGDRWQWLRPRQVGEAMLAAVAEGVEPFARLRTNPFAWPDFPDLVARGFGEGDVRTTDAPLRLTAKGLDALRRWVRPAPAQKGEPS